MQARVGGLLLSSVAILALRIETGQQTLVTIFAEVGTAGLSRSMDFNAALCGACQCRNAWHAPFNVPLYLSLTLKTTVALLPSPPV